MREATATLSETRAATGAAMTDGAPAPGPPLYPVALRLDGRLCLVVGGGDVARRKASELLAAGARVRVVAPEWPADFGALAAEAGPRLLRVTRRFAPGDADGAALVVAATDDVAVQEEAARAAADRGLFCNVVDVIPLCTFQVPAVLRRGALSISVATDGLFPLLAVALRDRIAVLVGGHFGPVLGRLAEARARARARYPEDAGARTRALRALLTGEAVDDLLAGRLAQFETRVAAWDAALGMPRGEP
jgi:siroheme synthase-like protein